MQGIKFNTQGIKAIQDGVKTMFRIPISSEFIVDPARFKYVGVQETMLGTVALFTNNKNLQTVTITPKYKVGETVFVMEEFAEWGSRTLYKLDDKTSEEFLNMVGIGWRPASEMKEHQARIFLKIKSIKVERLQDISEEDCMREGITISCNSKDCVVFNQISNEGNRYGTAKEAFKNDIWNNLPYKEPYDWNGNRPIFVYEFERVAK